MAKTTEKETKEKEEQSAAVIRQLQQRFAGFWQRLTAPVEASSAGENEAETGYVQEYLSSLKERAYLERTIANQYRGRYLFELIQNAVDAMHKQANSTTASKKSAKTKPATTNEATQYRCHIELTSEALYVANDGLGFEAEDVRGICAMGQSTKPAGEYIGYKGLGFRAVLEITDAPEIYSGQYQFGFSRAETLDLLATPGAPANLPDMEVPVLSVPHLRAATTSNLPPGEQEVLARLKKAEYVTIVRLPLKTGRVHEEVREACQELLSSHTLLFLPYISELSVAIAEKAGDGSLVTIEKSARELAIRPNSLTELVKVSRLNFQRTEAPFPAKNKKTAQSTEKSAVQEDWVLVESRQPLPLESSELVESLEDSTWKLVNQVNLATAFPLARMPWGGGEVFLKYRPEPLPFFAHFPTQEGSGLGFAVHSDFYLSASRKQIEWGVPYNQWLTHKLVGFICGPALDAIHYLYPDEAALIEILVDYPYYSDYFGRAFREVLDNRLITTAFVPVGNGLYMPPNRVVWTPLGQDGVLIFRRVFRYPGHDLHYPVLQLEEVYALDKPSAESASAATDSYTSSDDSYSSSYDYDRTSRSYEYYTDSNSYDYETNEDSYSTSRAARPAEAPMEFDYKRIQRFLSRLGVRKLSPRQLSQIYGQALQGWENGLLLTGEICAALALWYEALAKSEDYTPRSLIEQAQSLAVLPTLTEGWQAPENRQFTFAEPANPLNMSSYFSDENVLVEDTIALDGATEQGQQIVYIRPEAYELAEFKEQVKNWHRALGVRPQS